MSEEQREVEDATSEAAEPCAAAVPLPGIDVGKLGEGAREPAPVGSGSELAEIEDGPTEVVDYDSDRRERRDHRRGRRRFVPEAEDDEDVVDDEPAPADAARPRRRLVPALLWAAFILVNLAALAALTYFLWRAFGSAPAAAP